LLAGGVLECRLGLILLDNAAELLMARALNYEFGFEDFFFPRDNHPRLDNTQRPKYTAEERAKAEWEFEPKLRILGFRLGKLTPEERAVLKVCHRLRNEAFHTGAVRLRAPVGKWASTPLRK
jgi:hypothetical protein